MYNHNKAQQSKNRVHISWDILYESDQQFVRYSKIQWDTNISKHDLKKFKVKVMGEVKSQGHIVYPLSYANGSVYSNISDIRLQMIMTIMKKTVF